MDSYAGNKEDSVPKVLSLGLYNILMYIMNHGPETPKFHKSLFIKFSLVGRPDFSFPQKS